MKKSTKMFMTGAATLLAVALATGGAYAATGSLTSVDAPGQVLKVSGVGPASEHASENGLEHANPNAKGLFGWTESTHAPRVKDDARDKAAKDKAVKDKAVKDKAVKDKAVKDKVVGADKPAKVTTPSKQQHPSSVEGDDDDAEKNEPTTGSSGRVEAVAPDDAVEVDNDAEDAEDTEDREDAEDSDDESDDSGHSDDESDESDD